MAVGVNVGVGVNVAVAVGVNVGVGVGVGVTPEAQYLPPEFKGRPARTVLPSHTIISLPVHTPSTSFRPAGALDVLVGF